jgi:hypothetical protein
MTEKKYTIFDKLLKKKWERKIIRELLTRIEIIAIRAFTVYRSFYLWCYAKISTAVCAFPQPFLHNKIVALPVLFEVTPQQRSTLSKIHGDPQRLGHVHLVLNHLGLHVSSLHGLWGCSRNTQPLIYYCRLSGLPVVAYVLATASNLVLASAVSTFLMRGQRSLLRLVTYVLATASKLVLASAAVSAHLIRG